MKRYIRKLLFKELKDKLALQDFCKEKYEETKNAVWYKKYLNLSKDISNIQNFIQQLEKTTFHR